MIDDENDSPLLMDGFEQALLGFGQRINEPLLAIYSWSEMVKVLMTRDGMSDEEAIEYISYNCQGAWVGERTPIIVEPPENFPEYAPE